MITRLYKLPKVKNLREVLTPGLLSFCLNLPLILIGLPFKSFDAYTHIFLADHYRRWPFDLFEARWFGGFSVASYPPLTHQLIALFSFPLSALASWWGGTANEIRFRGEAAAYCIVLLLVLAALPMAVERFAAIFVPVRAARTAGWLAVGLPSVYLTAYAFGQLPTLAASAAALWAMGTGWQFIRGGRLRDLISAALWAGVTAAAHHAVLVFAIIAGGAMALHALFSPLRAQRTRREDKSFFSVLSVSSVVNIFRLTLWAVPSAGFAAIVIWPFIQWSAGYAPQTPIDHLSRHNFLADPLALYYFFLPMYGPILLALPVMLNRVLPWRSLRPSRFQSLWRKRRHWPLLAAALLLFTLGLGGTTPLPRLLFGANWEWLTYDRFSLWAGITLLPFAGLLVNLFFHREGAKSAKEISRKEKNFAFSAPWRFVLLLFCLFAAFAAVPARSQPPARDLATVAKFLNDPLRRHDRYFTFGLGDQMAKLSVLTDAATIDGAYFTAREMPELRRSGLGTLDGAIWNPQGAEAVAPFLDRAGEWGVRWAFVAHNDFVPVLARAGWRLEGVIVPGVEVWRDHTAPTPALPRWPFDCAASPLRSGCADGGGSGAAAIWWGVAPLITLALALLAARTNPIAGTIRSYGIWFLGFGFWDLLFVLWPFWYYVPLWSRPHAGVYYTYTSGLFFLADAVALCVILGNIRKSGKSRNSGNSDSPILPHSHTPTLPHSHTLTLSLPLSLSYSAILLFSLLSIPASIDPWLSLGFTLHLAAMGVVAWAAGRAAKNGGWQSIARALTIGLAIQSLLAVIQAATQTTEWTMMPGLKWPGLQTAATIGASVVGMADGTRWLRAYGTLPHPNLLAGYLVVAMAGPFIGYTQTGRTRWLWPLAFGAAALSLTFSRAGWLASGAAMASMVVLLPGLARRRGVIAAGVVAVVSLALAVALAPLFLTRVTANAGSPQESFSISDRQALAGLAITFIKNNPLNGVGAGGFVPTLAAATTLTPEPVHNVPLLAAAETGVGGGAAVILVGVIALWQAWRVRGQSIAGSVFASALIGLMVIGMFDHFLWSLSPGRLLAAVGVGMWWGARNPKSQ